MDILCSRTNVRLHINLASPTQPVVNNTQGSEVELSLASFQPKEAKNTCLACVQSVMDNAVSLI